MARPRWNHSIEYFPFVLRVVSEKARRNALDVGSGDGVLAAHLAALVPSVTGLDLDQAQVDAATTDYGPVPGLTFLQGDLRDTTPPGAPFDAVVSSSTIHHLELEVALRRLAELTASGGTLVVVGLAVDTSLWDHIVSAASILPNRIMRARHGWYDHGAPMDDPRDSWATVRDVTEQLLPGVEYRRRLYWRYTLVWNKP